MFLLLEDNNEAVLINTANITNIHCDFKTETLIIYYTGESETSEFQYDDALRIYNYLKSIAVLLSIKE